VTVNWVGLRRFFASKALLPERFLATILFTDIVGSTATASEVGDTAWTELLAHHEQDVRRELERVHGREVKNTGDGVLAVFEGPASALRCAAAIRASANRQAFISESGSTPGRSSPRAVTSAAWRCTRLLA